MPDFSNPTDILRYVQELDRQRAATGPSPAATRPIYGPAPRPADQYIDQLERLRTWQADPTAPVQWRAPQPPANRPVLGPPPRPADDYATQLDRLRQMSQPQQPAQPSRPSTPSIPSTSDRLRSAPPSPVNVTLPWRSQQVTEALPRPDLGAPGISPAAMPSTTTQTTPYMTPENVVGRARGTAANDYASRLDQLRTLRPTPPPQPEDYDLPGMNGWRPPAQPYADYEAARQADQEAMRQQAMEMGIAIPDPDVESPAAALDRWMLENNPAYAYTKSRIERRDEEAVTRQQMGITDWYADLTRPLANAFDATLDLPGRTLWTSVPATVRARSEEENAQLSQYLTENKDRITLPNLLAGNVPPAPSFMNETLSLAQATTPAGSVANRLLNPFNPNRYQANLPADATPEQRLAAGANMLNRAYTDYVTQFWSTVNLNQTIAALPPEQRATAQIALANSISGPERTWAAYNQIMAKQNTGQMYAAAAALNAEGRTQEASQIYQQARALDNMTNADIVDNNMNLWAEMIVGIVGDPLNFAIDPLVDAGINAWRAGRSANRLRQAAANAPDALTRAAEEGARLAGLVSEGQPVVAPKNFFQWLFGRTENTLAHQEADAIWRSATQIFQHVDNAADARKILTAWVEDPAALIRGITGLTGDNLKAIAGGMGNRVRYGYLAVADNDMLKALPNLQLVKEELLNLPMLAGDAPFNKIEFLSKLDELSYKAARQKYGLQALDAIPHGAAKYNVLNTGTGKYVVDFLDKDGKSVYRTAEMALADAQSYKTNLDQAMKGAQQSGILKAMNAFASIQRGFMSDMWLNLRPSHWIRNAIAATAATMADDLYTLDNMTSILDDLGAKFAGGAATRRTAEAMTNAGTFGTQAVGSMTDAGQHWTRKVWDKNNPYAAANEAAANIWAGMTHIFGNVPFGEQAFYMRAFHKGFQRTFGSTWTQLVSDVLSPRMQQLAVPEPIARAIVDRITSAGIYGSKVDVANAARKAVYGSTVSFDPRTLGIPDELLSADGWKLIQNGIEDWLQMTPDPAARIPEISGWLRTIAGDEKLRYANILRNTPPQPGVYEWSAIDNIRDGADIIDSITDAARKAGLDPRQAEQDATKLVTDMLDRQNAAIDTVLQEVAQSTAPDPSALNLAFDMLANVHALKTEARRNVDALGRVAAELQTPEAWAKKWTETGRIYTELSQNLEQTILSYVDDLRTLQAGGTLERKYDWWSAVNRYFEYDIERVGQLRLTELTNTRTNRDLWEAAIDANRQYLDASMVQLYDAFKRYPSVDGLDILRSAQKSIDQEGAKVAAYLAELRQPLEAASRQIDELQAAGKRVPRSLWNKVTDGWAQYHGARNSAWYRGFDNMVLYNEAAKRAIVARGLYESVPTQLQWDDAFAGGRFFLLGDNPDKKGTWLARRLDDGSLHVFDTPGRDPKSAMPMVPDEVLADWKTVTERSQDMQPVLDEIAAANPIPERPAATASTSPIPSRIRSAEPDLAPSPTAAPDTQGMPPRRGPEPPDTAAPQPEPTGPQQPPPAPQTMEPAPYLPSTQAGPFEGEPLTPEELATLTNLVNEIDFGMRPTEVLDEYFPRVGDQVVDSVTGKTVTIQGKHSKKAGMYRAADDTGKSAYYDRRNLTPVDAAPTEPAVAESPNLQSPISQSPTDPDPNALLTKPKGWTTEQRATYLEPNEQVTIKKTGETVTVIERAQKGGYYWVRKADGSKARYKPQSLARVEGPPKAWVTPEDAGMATYESPIRLPRLRSGAMDGWLTDDPQETLANLTQMLLGNWRKEKQPEVADAAAHMITTIDDAIERVIDQLPQLAQRSPNTLDAGQRRFLLDTIDRLIPQFDNAVAESQRVATELANRSMLNYQDRRGFDQMLSLVFPYHYFWTRGGKTWAQRLAMQPATLNTVYEIKRAIDTGAQQRDLPQRLSTTMPTGINAFGGEFRAGNPLNWVMPQPINEFVDPEEANNNFERWLMRMQQITPGFMPVTQLAINAILDRTNPLSGGRTRVNETIRKYVPMYGVAGDVTQALTGERLPGSGDQFDPYRTRRALGIMVDEGALNPDTARYAQQISLNLENGADRYTNVPESARAAADAAYLAGQKRAGAERAVTSVTGLAAGIPVYYYAEGEGNIRQAQQQYAAAGYDPVANPYGSKAAKTDIIRNTPALAVYWSRNTQAGDLQPGQRVRVDEMHRRLEEEAYGPMTTAVIAALTANPNLTTKELNAVKRPYWDAVNAIKTEYADLPSAGPATTNGMNDAERAIYELQNALRVEGKPAYPGQDADPATLQQYYRDLAAYEETRLTTIEQRLTNSLADITSTSDQVRGTTPGWKLMLAGLVRGQYASELVRKYDDLSHAPDIERAWSDRTSLLDEAKAADINASNAAIAARFGEPMLTTVSAYYAADDATKQTMRQDPALRAALVAGRYPDQYDRATAYFGQQVWTDYYSPDKPQYPTTPTPEATDAYYAAMDRWNLAHPADAEFRLWLNGLYTRGDTLPDGYYYPYDFGKDHAEAIRIFGPEIFAIEREKLAAADWNTWKRQNPDKANLLYGYWNWQKEQRTRELAPLPSTSNLQSPISPETYTGPRPVGSNRQPIGGQPSMPQIAPQNAATPSAQQNIPGTPVTPQPATASTAQSAISNLPTTAAEWAAYGRTPSQASARIATVGRAFGAEVDSLYQQYLALPANSPQRQAFKQANPELRAVQLYVYEPAIYKQMVDQFGMGAVAGWAFTPPYAEDNPFIQKVRSEYLDRNPTAWQVSAWLNGRPTASTQSTESTDFTYNAGADYATAKQMFGADIWDSVLTYRSSQDKRGYGDRDRVLAFYDWWYAGLPDSTGRNPFDFRSPQSFTGPGRNYYSDAPGRGSGGGYGGGGGGGGGFPYRLYPPDVNPRYMLSQLWNGPDGYGWRAPDTTIDLTWMNAGTRLRPDDLRAWRAPRS